MVAVPPSGERWNGAMGLDVTEAPNVVVSCSDFASVDASVERRIRATVLSGFGDFAGFQTRGAHSNPLYNAFDDSTNSLKVGASLNFRVGL